MTRAVQPVTLAVTLALLAAGPGVAAQAVTPAPAGVAAAASQSVAAEGMAMRIVSLLRNAPEVGQALAGLDSRQADEKAARLARFPRLDVQGEAGSLSTESGRDPRSQVDSRIVVGTRYTLYDFGRISARIAAAERGVAAGQQSVRVATETVALDALTTYLQVLRFALLRDVGRDSERALRGIEQLEARRVELGGAGITDARLASSRLALSTNRLVQFEASLQESLARFAALFGFQPMPEQLVPLRVPGAWLQQDAQQLLALAQEGNPQLQAARHALEQARQALEAERAARWPAVDLTWSRRYEFPGGVSDKPQIGVMLSTSSSSMIEGQARVGRAVARVAEEEDKLRLLERDIAQAVLTAAQRHALGRERETLLRAAAGDSAAVFQGRQKLNAAGRDTTLALLDAQVESNNVLIDWVNALFDQRLAELRLAKESGRLLPEPDDALGWARALFPPEDFRAPVRSHLAANAMQHPALATAGGPPAPAAPPASGRADLGNVGAAWSSRIGLVRAQR